MKKLFLILVSTLLLVTRVYAVSAEDVKVDINNYETKNLKEILESEQIKLENADYKETDDQVTIYLFRGDGCGYCRNFLTFLSSISKEYGEYFKVVGFEVWSNQDNAALLDKISTFMGNAAGGVPYIIIGDSVFPGYAETYDDSIKAAIKDLYNSKDRYDVFKEYNKAIDQAKKAANGNAPTIIFWNFVFIAIGTVTVVLFNKKNNKQLLEKLEELNAKKPVKEVVKEEKKVVKKVKNAKKKK